MPPIIFDEKEKIYTQHSNMKQFGGDYFTGFSSGKISAYHVTGTSSTSSSPPLPVIFLIF